MAFSDLGHLNNRDTAAGAERRLRAGAGRLRHSRHTSDAAPVDLSAVVPAGLEGQRRRAPPVATPSSPAILEVSGRRHHGASTRVALGGLVVAALSVLGGTERHLLVASAAALGHLRWAWMLPAAGAGSLSLLAMARMQRRLLAIGGIHLSTATATATVYASNAISSTVPLAGPELGTAYAFRRYQQRGAGGVTTAWMLTISGVVSVMTFGFIVSFSALASDNTTATVVGTAGTFGLTVAVVALVVSLRNLALRARVEPVIVRVVRAAQWATRRRSGDARMLVDTALEQMGALHLGRRDWLWTSGAGGLNWLADALCLALTIKAVGFDIAWPHVLLVWVAGATVGALRLTPGGLGIVEAAMIAALVASGMPSEIATTSVLAYRLISFWMPLAIGWTLQLARCYGSRPVPVDLQPLRSRKGFGLPAGAAGRLGSGSWRGMGPRTGRPE